MSTLRKFIWSVLTVSLAAVLVTFAVINRHAVNLVLDPVGANDHGLSVDIPVFLLVFAALALGLLLGGITTWLSQGKWRKQARQSSSEASRWQSEVDRLNAQLVQSEQARLPQPTSGE